MPTKFQWKKSSQNSTTFAVCKSASNKPTHRVSILYGPYNKKSNIYPICAMKYIRLRSSYGKPYGKKLACPHHLETQYRQRRIFLLLRSCKKCHSFVSWKINKNALETDRKLRNLFDKILKHSDNQSKGKKCIYLYAIWFSNIKVSKVSTVWIKSIKILNYKKFRRKYWIHCTL